MFARIRFLVALLIISCAQPAFAKICGDIGSSKPMTIPVSHAVGPPTEEPLYSGSYALVVGSSTFDNWDALDDVTYEADAIANELARQGFMV